MISKVVLLLRIWRKIQRRKVQRILDYIQIRYTVLILNSKIEFKIKYQTNIEQSQKWNYIKNQH